MNRFTLFTLLLIATVSAKADVFISNGDTSYFVNSYDPLKSYPRIEAIRPELKSFVSTAFDSSCNLYNAEWTNIKGELYLTNIYKCNDYKGAKADINKLFNVKDGKVKADWITDTLWLSKGKFVASFDIMRSFRSAERMVVVVKGKIISTKDITYPVQQNEIYHNGNVDVGYIYQHFNWKSIPSNHYQAAKFYVTIESGTTGTPDKVEIVRGPADTLLRKEIMRVMTDIPWFSVYYHGKVQHLGYTIPLVFSEENRKKYTAK